ncbi:MAG TPA: amidohydrolase family protein [Candidatus Binatia bacterium]|nr:amidohydrolase family protein [Candidatus Binatia bacterium]
MALLTAIVVAPSQQRAGLPSDLVLDGGKVYPSPTAASIEDAVVLVHAGKIAAIGKRGQIKVPKSAQVIDCTGKVIAAGFWNSHVHFTEDVWNSAATAPADKLERHMQEMLTRWGFTTVFDIGSFPGDTLALRKRVDSGEVPGPRIYTTAGAIYPENGIPVYIPPAIASQIKRFEAATPVDAARLAQEELAAGGDGIKLFTGAIMGHGKVTPMPVNIVRAAVDVAHAAGKPVFAHPSNHIGTDNALAGGVDILAHTIPMEGRFTDDELARMKAQHVALIPTLTLWEVELEKEHASADDERQFVQAGVNELKSYFDQGGTILFGTDVGYTQHYNTTEEYVLMARSGMGWRDILASLTTNPAIFFKAAHTAELVKGYPADLVVLSGDPASDVGNFAHVDYTIRAGKVIYRK